MKEGYKYSLWAIIESYGWVVAPIPASGAGRKGRHRPDLIFGNGRKVYVAEVKNAKLPIYLNYEKDVKPVIKFAKALSAEPIVVFKKKRARKWMVLKIEDLKGCSENNYVLNVKTLDKSRKLEDLLKEESVNI